MGTNTGTVMTIANSIIGVSVLAMPFCFKECGIFLSILMLILSSVLSRLTCFLVLKAAVMSRRRNFEFLAFHVFGTTGKFLVELCIIGFLMGTCIAFFVVVGDLGPAIIAKTLSINNTSSLRPSVLIGLAFLVVLPLGLLRNVDSLSSICTATIGFYVCLVLKVIVEALPHLRSGIWIDKVEYWRPDGILQCLPIFSMALFCQTQLFEIYETMPNASLEKMNGAVRSAINICTGVYISVGFFGYVAFCTETFSGNVLMSFSPSTMSDIIKLGFVLSVAVSFPLVIFPCRASLYSLLFRRIQVPHHEVVSSYIPEPRFKCITFFIISVSLVIGLMIPNIELVLGLVGSTIGVGICVIFPTMAFIFVSTKDTAERVVAQVLFFVGILILVLGTYATLYAANESANVAVKVAVEKEFINPLQLPNIDKNLLQEKVNIPLNVGQNEIVKEIPKAPAPGPVIVVSEKSAENNVVNVKDSVEVRQEPPVPVEPVDKIPMKNSQEETKDVKIKENKESPASKEEVKLPGLPVVEKQVEETITVKNTDVKEKVVIEQVINKDALKKEDEELAEAENQAKADMEQKNNQLLLKLEKHKEDQQKLLEEQKQILQELKEQKKEADKEKEGSNIPMVAVAESVVKEVEPLPVNQVKEPSVQAQEVLSKDQDNENNKPDLPKMPKFGYVSQPDNANKALPPKQPLAYERRFSSNEETAKINSIHAQGLEKSSLPNKQHQIPNIPQAPSIKSLLLPPAHVPSSVPVVSNLRQSNIVKSYNEIVKPEKTFQVEKESKTDVLPKVSNDHQHEIIQVKNIEILKENIVGNEAKAMRRDILGASSVDLKVAKQDHEREKRDTLLEESVDQKSVADISIINEVREQLKAKDDKVENCDVKDKSDDENKMKLEETLDKKVVPSSGTIIAPKDDGVSVIKESLHLSEPILKPLGEASSLVDSLQKELLENGIKPMSRDLKSVNAESADDQAKESNPVPSGKKQA